MRRWLKYEERVEIGERWSKPHVSTTTLRGLQMFREALVSKQCCVGLDQPLPGGQFQVAGNDRSNANNNANADANSNKSEFLQKAASSSRHPAAANRFVRTWPHLINGFFGPHELAPNGTSIDSPV